MLHTLSLAIQMAVAGTATDGVETSDRIAQAATASISPGSSVSGTLDSADQRREGGEFVDHWTLEGEAGERFRVTMRSDAFDTWVGVRGPGAFQVSNDDAPGMGTNSNIVVTLPATGTYTIQATSYAAGQTGPYTLEVQPWTPGAQPVHQGTAQVAPPTNAPILAAGRDVTGELASADPTLRTGEYFDAYVYQGRAGEAVSFTLSSSDFDTYLMVRGPNGLTLDNDDFEEGRLDSAIGVTLPADGPYRVLVTSFRPGETGRYTLRASSSGQADTVVGGRLDFGTPVSGTLSASDPVRAGGQHFQSWTFSGRAGQMVTIDLRSDELDTFLVMRTPTGDERTNDDIAQRDTNSRIHAVLDADGDYQILASTYLAGATGRYSLSVVASDLDNVIAETESDGGDVDTIVFGSEISGRLARRDSQLQSGEFYDTISFTGTSGQGLTLSMESNQFDTYLMLRGPGGLSVDNDDGFADGSTNSRLEATLPVDGTYTILATSYAPGETGRYTLRLDEGTTVQQNARGRVYAILAGITDYADASDLPFCADDAIKLGETLGTTGILADESIVLTNDQVTVANLERAFLEVARRAGPEDVFLFFYSGHGAHLENRRELDGRDETLYLIDGHVTDDQVNTWFDSVSARLAIIALDSCFSGGFARDVISAPNRMGIFSSEEDVTSNVASRFQAGGYLSYFLRTGIAGAADAEPRDGIITAGELSQYLHRQWAAHDMVNESTETADAATAYQNLVIDRGSVKVTDVIVYTE